MKEVRTAYCLVSIAPVRKTEGDNSEIVSQLLFGELVEVKSINHPWAKISVLSDGYEGYIDHKHIIFLTEKEAQRWRKEFSYLKAREAVLNTPWGKQHICRGSFIPENATIFSIGSDHFSLEKNNDNESESILKYAENYLNTPYLWGGKSPFGIDCSGLTQIIYRFFGWNLPRDCDKQVHHGQKVDYESIQPGDLAFFQNKSNKVTHVGILDGKGGIIHASGHVRKDRFTRKGIFREDIESLTHSLYLIKRL